MTEQRARRWDNDEIGHGVASAAGHLAAINELADLAAQPAWVTEDPEAHLLPGLRRGAESAGLTITSFAIDPEGCFAVHLMGASAMSRRDLRQAAWTILGAVAELSSHVRELRTDDTVTFETVTGNPAGDGPFVTHGHTLRLVFAATS